MLWGFVLIRFPCEKSCVQLCDAWFTTVIVLLLLISQALSLIQSAIFENIIHMLKFNSLDCTYQSLLIALTFHLPLLCISGCSMYCH